MSIARPCPFFSRIWILWTLIKRDGRNSQQNIKVLIGDIIKVYCDYEIIAVLERVYNKFGYLGKFRFCDVNLDDLENAYKFLKSKKIKFKKL